jgi:long-subunit fatty acid transport protein
MTRRSLRLLLGLLTISLASPAQAALVGTIFSGPTTGDAASVYWNPGAMTLRGGTHSLAFGAVSAVRLHYQRDQPSAFDNQIYPQADVFVPKPNMVFGAVTDAGFDRWRFGLAVSVPIIDGASWDETYGGKAASTRAYAMRARLIMLQISPAVAFRINKYISVGAGLDVVGMFLTQDVMTDLGAKVNQMACSALDPNAVTCLGDAPLAREDPTWDAKTKIDGSGWGVGGFFGVLITPTPRLRIGGSFRTGAGILSLGSDLGLELPEKLDGYLTKNFPTVAATLPPLEAEGYVDAVSPMIAAAGVAVDLTPQLELAFDMHWFDYSATSTLVGTITRPDAFNLITNQVFIKQRDDGFLFGLRGRYTFLDGRLLAALRVEYEPNTRPEHFTSPVSIDYHKFSLHAGVGWQVLPWLWLSLEYGHYILLDREVKESRFAPNYKPDTPEEQGFDKPTPTGLYTGEADRVGIGVEVSF